MAYRIQGDSLCWLGVHLSSLWGVLFSGVMQIQHRLESLLGIRVFLSGVYNALIKTNVFE